jgi:hypothetical protein
VCTWETLIEIFKFINNNSRHFGDNNRVIDKVLYNINYTTKLLFCLITHVLYSLSSTEKKVIQFSVPDLDLRDCVYTHRLKR